MSKLGLMFVCLAALLLPGSVYSQPTKVLPAKTLKVTKVPPAAKVVVTPATQMAHIVVAPASQPAPAVAVAKVAPASQPAPLASWRAWLRDNWRYLLFVIVIPSLITALKKKGMREGIIGFLESVLERSSIAQPHNSYGTLKFPGQKAGPPVDPPKVS